jgi:hypothetical protein
VPIVPEELLSALLQQLQQSAQPRPDLGVDRPMTYLGRMVRPGELTQSVLSRFPQAELETGGTAMQAGDLLKAAIPAAFWRRAPDDVKASLTYVMNEQPELMRRALAIKDRILPELEPKSTVFGSAERLTPDVYALRIKPPPSNMAFSPGTREQMLAETGTHELTHILQNPRVLATQPEDAATIGRLLNDVIAEKDPWLNRGSLTRSVRALEDFFSGVAKTQKLGTPGILLSPTTRTRYSGLGGPEMSIKEAYGRLAMDEGLATLAEAARDPRADPMIKFLARQLDLGIVPKR